MTRKKQSPAAAPADNVATVSALVLSTARIGEVSYSPGCIIEGIPETVAQAHTNVLSLSPAAVAAAQEGGAPQVPFPV